MVMLRKEKKFYSSICPDCGEKYRWSHVWELLGNVGVLEESAKDYEKRAKFCWFCKSTKVRTRTSEAPSPFSRLEKTLKKIVKNLVKKYLKVR